MNSSSDTGGIFEDGASEASAVHEDALARAQLKDGAHEISDAAADVIDSVRAVTSDSFLEIIETSRELIRARPLAALATAAGIAYLCGRIRR